MVKIEKEESAFEKYFSKFILEYVEGQEMS